MKKNSLLFIVFIISTITVQAQKINWLTVEEAQELMKKEPRKVMIDMYTTWCGPCKMLDKNTFSNTDVINYINENFYAIKFNAEGDSQITFQGNTFSNPSYDPAKKNRRNSQHQFARHLGIRAYPSLAFFDEDFKLIAPIAGYLTPQKSNSI